MTFISTEAKVSSGGIGGDNSSDEDYSEDEDEGEDAYKPGGYHRVNVGDQFNSRYVVVEKLGWGHFSTVWMCFDRKRSTPENPDYVALKIQKSAAHYREAAIDEIQLLKCCSAALATPAAQAEYPKGENCVVNLVDSFDHGGKYGTHVCMAFEVCGENLLKVIKRYDYRGMPIALVRRFVRQICVGLDFLHRHCNIIHTDLKPENILITRPLKMPDTTIVKSLLAAGTGAGSKSGKSKKKSNGTSNSDAKGGPSEAADKMSAEKLTAEEKRKMKNKQKNKRRRNARKGSGGTAAGSAGAGAGGGETGGRAKGGRRKHRSNRNRAPSASDRPKSTPTLPAAAAVAATSTKALANTTTDDDITALVGAIDSPISISPTKMQQQEEMALMERADADLSAASAAAASLQYNSGTSIGEHNMDDAAVPELRLDEVPHPFSSSTATNNSNKKDRKFRPVIATSVDLRSDSKAESSSIIAGSKHAKQYSTGDIDGQDSNWVGKFSSKVNISDAASPKSYDGGSYDFKANDSKMLYAGGVSGHEDKFSDSKIEYNKEKQKQKEKEKEQQQQSGIQLPSWLRPTLFSVLNFSVDDGPSSSSSSAVEGGGGATPSSDECTPSDRDLLFDKVTQIRPVDYKIPNKLMFAKLRMVSTDKEKEKEKEKRSLNNRFVYISLYDPCSFLFWTKIILQMYSYVLFVCFCTIVADHTHGETNCSIWLPSVIPRERTCLR